MNLKNLNGWQRLWFVFSVLWVVSTVAWPIATGDFPTASELRAEYERQTGGDRMNELVLGPGLTKDIKELREVQAELVFLYLLMCVVPPAIVYALALGGWQVVLWVRQGFKLKGESND